ATSVTAVVALASSEPLTTRPRDLVLLVFFGVGQFSGGFLMFMVGARLIPAAQSALLGMLETVLGPVWVWLVMNERPGSGTMVGGALILGALLANMGIDLIASSRGRASSTVTGWSRVRASSNVTG